ncbi:MAG: nuclear transport factor 2 family protein [Gammaproteobacteria bacterium]
MKADSRTEEEVKIILHGFTDAYRKRDMKALFECIAPDADMVMYGTGMDEKCTGPEQIRTQVERDWAQSESAVMLFDRTTVSSSGQVAWAAVDGEFRFRAGGQDGTIPARVTFVLEKREGRWLIVHAHFSTPAADQKKGHSF